MISDFEELGKLFEEIDKNISEKVHLYIIGGVVLLHQGIKEATKDIDAVVGKEAEFAIIQGALKKLEFEDKIPTLEYRKTNLSQILVRDDFRIDLFHRTVCRGFYLSEAMKRRAKKVIAAKYLTVSLCSNEDVFLFKTFTEREGDITDCIALARMGINWDAVLDELKRQIKDVGDKVWITWVGERLDILKDRGVEIPILAEVDKLREEYYAELEKKFTS